MSMHRFYMHCDGEGCGERTAEYGSFPACFICLENFCPNCREQSFDDDERGRTLCKKCYAEELATNEKGESNV